jgi:two-component system response regulator WspF
VEGSVRKVFEALGVGALDAVDTPVLSGSKMQDGLRLLLAKIDSIGRIVRTVPEPAPPPKLLTSSQSLRRGGWLFAIGTSAGGPAALAQLLGTFPPETPAAFVVIQHLDRHFAPGLVDWLGKQIAMPVRLARDGDVPEAGVVLLPSREDHLILNPDGTLSYTSEPEDYVYRPSIDAFLTSVARHWKRNAVGVLLTGMGRDGAQGLKRMREVNFATIAQDQKSSAVYGMPKAAAQIGAAEQILALAEIGPALRQFL